MASPYGTANPLWYGELIMAHAIPYGEPKNYENINIK
jgi:hypothetical protein